MGTVSIYLIDSIGFASTVSRQISGFRWACFCCKLLILHLSGRALFGHLDTEVGVNGHCFWAQKSPSQNRSKRGENEPKTNYCTVVWCVPTMRSWKALMEALRAVLSCTL